MLSRQPYQTADPNQEAALLGPPTPATSAKVLSTTPPRAPAPPAQPSPTQPSSVHQQAGQLGWWALTLIDFTSFQSFPVSC